MRKTLLSTLLLCVGIVMSSAQPLLKTHVETGDVEGTLDGKDLAVYKAIPYAMRHHPWVISAGKHRSLPKPGRAC